MTGHVFLGDVEAVQASYTYNHTISDAVITTTTPYEL